MRRREEEETGAGFFGGDERFGEDDFILLGAISNADLAAQVVDLLEDMRGGRR